LPAGTHHLELNFNAIELTAPEKIRLQYRLDGADSEWLDTTPPGHAVYTALSPGTHAFHIRACNRSGIWDRAGVVYFITQQPYFYQTRWFLIAWIAFGLIVITGLYRMRMRHVVARVNMRFEERVAERTRIARDLHDTLLQSFNALLLRLQTVSNVLPSQPDEAKRRIEGAIEQASHAIVEGRDAVHEMRSTASATIDLDRAVSDFARELLSSSALDSAPEVQVHVEGAPKPLNPIVRDEVYRIVTEAIRNAIRHANARQIEVEIRYDKHHLRLRIGDNGKGVDPGLLDGDHKAGHWGLRGMRERAKLIGGSLDIWSHLGTGTEIELKIPAATGYARARASRPSVLSLFRRN
jgi:signal transduction histidine kinase